MQLKNLPFKFESACVRAWYRMADLRPGSAPFVSGDSFRGIADHIVEKGGRFDPARVKNGEVVFVEAWQIGYFFRTCLSRIREPFVLITHNGDLNINESFIPVATNNKVIHWFAQNSLLHHQKVTAIPIGLENRFYHYNGVIRDFRRLAFRKTLKARRILFGFTVETNLKERLPALEALRESNLADTFKRTNSREYRARLERYAFVASPPGNGVDCHRTWEGLYLGAIPVVKRSIFYDAFPGLPVLAIRDWAEIATWDSSFLSQAYEELSKKIESCPYLKFEFWVDLVSRAKAAVS